MKDFRAAEIQILLGVSTDIQSKSKRNLEKSKEKNEIVCAHIYNVYANILKKGAFGHN